MHLGSAVCDTIVALGYENRKNDGVFTIIGTGFLQAFDGGSYLVTARHVAEHLADAPFSIRANRNREIGSDIIHLDYIKWYFHKDTSVDIA
ncbi:MAG: hypothetical protein N2444_10585, partial [Methylocystis sp.]|nr:hypothetical protein [Methylocystis sp.]